MKKTKQKKQKNKKKQTTAEAKKVQRVKLIFSALMLLSGLVIFSYPFISNALAQRNASEVIERVEEQTKELAPEKLDAIKEAARQYNEQLDAVETFDGDEEGTSYVDVMDAGEALGYIVIPCINVELPIYEGTSDTVLQKGVGHLKDTSYPLGGVGTHCVLSAHRGLSTAELFTNLDRMKYGDIFRLHVLDEILAYQVDQILVVEPHETEALQVIPGGDYCTLVTCTPLGLNTHRLLVRGRRTAYIPDGEGEVKYQSLRTGDVVRRLAQLWPWLLLVTSIVIGSEGLLLLLILRRMRRRAAMD